METAVSNEPSFRKQDILLTSPVVSFGSKERG
jgi:hypothetical protein